VLATKPALQTPEKTLKAAARRVSGTLSAWTEQSTGGFIVVVDQCMNGSRQTCIVSW
jgi:FlaG/FlaF family flagellin (archaellin)